MRIDKFLSQLKYATRSEAKRFLSMHNVMINQSRISDPTYKIDPTKDKIIIDEEEVFYQEHLHLALYKPKGYLSAHHDAMHPCLFELIKSPNHRFNLVIAGRLDLDAEGLVILTTDGSFAHQLTHPKQHIEKTYEVILDQPFHHPQDLLKGISIKDGKGEIYLAKALAIDVNKNHVKLTIDEGKFHQVKRMFLAVGYEVIHLKRVQFGKLNLNHLLPGDYVEIRKEDII
jgi:16S rRNA pseudouridine516 synthase